MSSATTLLEVLLLQLLVVYACCLFYFFQSNVWFATFNSWQGNLIIFLKWLLYFRICWWCSHDTNRHISIDLPNSRAKGQEYCCRRVWTQTLVFCWILMHFRDQFGKIRPYIYVFSLHELFLELPLEHLSR